MTVGRQQETELMWPSLVALAAVGALHAALPERIAIYGPKYLLACIVVFLILPGEFAHKKGKHGYCKLISYAVLVVLTAAMINSVGLLVYAITRHDVSPEHLLSSASILWVTNVVVFATWYWRLDAGGPHKRGALPTYSSYGAFLFPQMTITDEESKDRSWSPRFIDYLFLAFNTSTALSPTDAPVLSRWAKVLMMIQALISLTIVVLLAARAVNVI